MGSRGLGFRPSLQRVDSIPRCVGHPTDLPIEELEVSRHDRCYKVYSNKYGSQILIWGI